MYSHTHMDWEGAGWYAPQSVGNICFLTYIGNHRWGYDASLAARRLNYGTPKYYWEPPADRNDFYIVDVRDGK